MADVHFGQLVRNGDRAVRHLRQGAAVRRGLDNHLNRPLPQPFPRDQLADETQRERLPRRNGPPGPEDLPRRLHPDETGQPLRPPGARNDADVRLGLPGENPESFARDPEVAGHGQLVPAPYGHPVQRADHRLPKPRDPVKDPVGGPREPLPVAG